MGVTAQEWLKFPPSLASLADVHDLMADNLNFAFAFPGVQLNSPGGIRTGYGIKSY